MVAVNSLNPACYLPSSISNLLPSKFACPPPPSTLQAVLGAITAPLTSTWTLVSAMLNTISTLPFLSLLFIPTITSYSTSLNLLFFYLTWSTLVLSHDPLRIEVFASLACRVLFYVFPSALFLVLDVLFPGISAGLKSLGEDGLPFRNLSRKNVTKHFKLVGWSLFNVVLGAMTQAVIEWVLVSQLGQTQALRVSTSLPLPWAIAKDLLKGLLARDALSYLFHQYLLHAGSSTNALCRDLTRLHQRWYHKDVLTPFPLAATYDHPLAYIIKSFLPMYLPAIYWRFHALTFFIYTIVISLEEAFTYSGYSRLPTNFILGGIANRHEVHCASNGQGNYGSWGLCDWLAGSSLGIDSASDGTNGIEEIEATVDDLQPARSNTAKVRRAASRSSRSTVSTARPRRRVGRPTDDGGDGS